MHFRINIYAGQVIKEGNCPIGANVSKKCRVEISGWKCPRERPTPVVNSHTNKSTTPLSSLPPSFRLFLPSSKPPFPSSSFFIGFFVRLSFLCLPVEALSLYLRIAPHRFADLVSETHTWQIIHECQILRTLPCAHIVFDVSEGSKTRNYYNGQDFLPQPVTRFADVCSPPHTISVWFIIHRRYSRLLKMAESVFSWPKVYDPRGADDRRAVSNVGHSNCTFLTFSSSYRLVFGEGFRCDNSSRSSHAAHGYRFH